MAAAEDIIVVNNKDKRRFEVSINGEFAFID
jgi:hypothetical protein